MTFDSLWQFLTAYDSFWLPPGLSSSQELRSACCLSSFVMEIELMQMMFQAGHFIMKTASIYYMFHHEIK